MRYGLRPLLLASLVLAAAVTLGAAAIALLGPLQDRLRDQTVETVEDAVRDHVAAFDDTLAALREAKVPYAEYDTRLFSPAFSATSAAGLSGIGAPWRIAGPVRRACRSG